MRNNSGQGAVEEVSHKYVEMSEVIPAIRRAGAQSYCTQVKQKWEGNISDVLVIYFFSEF